MKTVIAIVSLAGMAGAASAIEAQTATFAGTARADLSAGTFSTNDGTFDRTTVGLIYDNTETFGVSGFSHGSDFVRDDLALNGGGVLETLGFTVANFGANAYTGGFVEFAFTDALTSTASTPGDLIATFALDLDAIFGGTLSVGSLGVTTITIGGLDGLGINFSEDQVILAGLRFLDDGGSGDIGSLGQGLFDPPVVGASNDFAFFDGFGGGFNSPFAANPANFGWAIETIPTPGAMAVLGMAGLAATRRRR